MKIEQIQLPPVNLNLEDWRQKLQQSAEASMSWQISRFFSRPIETHVGTHDKGGDGYHLIKAQLEALALEDHFQTQVAQKVHEEFAAMRDKCVHAALEHIVRGHAFREAVSLAVEAAQKQLKE